MLSRHLDRLDRDTHFPALECAVFAFKTIDSIVSYKATLGRGWTKNEKIKRKKKIIKPSLDEQLSQ